MKKWLYWVLLVLFAVVFSVSACYLADYFIESYTHNAQFDELAQLVEQSKQETKPVPTDPDGTAPKETVPSGSGDLGFLPNLKDHVTVTHPETGETMQILREYALIFQKNPDLVGWIKIEGTKINYPVMQTPDFEDYYLVRDFYGQPSAHGCIYVNETSDVFKPSDNLLIHGHRMKDGSMFALLHKYKDKKFWQDHPLITFDTITEHHTYQILSVFLTTVSVGEGFPYYQFIDAADQAEFDEFVGLCKEFSLYDTGVDASYGNKLITLSTCEYSQENGRMVVVAKRIS